jgi:glutamate-ammonia-ligase adenylyltransferase
MMQKNLAEALLEQVEDSWQSWLDVAPDEAGDLINDAPFIQQLKQVWEASHYVSQSCCMRPALLLELYNSGDLNRCYELGEQAKKLATLLEGVDDETTLQHHLRQFRCYQMCRIIWRDLTNSAELNETLGDLSNLANACIRQATTLLYQWTTDQLGTPRDSEGNAQPLVILGMGKLGAYELNLSSDIDLIFAYPRNGQTDGRRQLYNEQFFTRLCQKLIKAINTVTTDGFVFRVDTRLRPFGDAGPLAISFDAMEVYYESQAREWERYAMIKGRIICATPEAKTELVNMLKPFVYRRYLDYGAYNSLRSLKRMISKELYKKGMDANIKLGMGGIREIEFIGQAFQLIRGGRDPELQIRPILQVLQVAGKRGLLPEKAVTELSEAYHFLRLVENRIQAWEDKQTHLLPSDELAQLRLARSMGFDSWPPFAEKLQNHRNKVQGHFDLVFSAPQAEDEEPGELDFIWGDKLDEELTFNALQAAGFKQPNEALQQLISLHSSHTHRRMSPSGHKRLAQLMPYIIQAASAVENADQALGRLLKLIEAIAQRTSYLALLIESPMALSQLVKLSAASSWIADRLTRFPILLDELIDPRRLYAPVLQHEMSEELDHVLAGVDIDDLEGQMDRLRQFTKSHRLRVAAADITEHISLMVVSDYLTAIAEVVTERVMCQAWHDMVAKYGKPSHIEGGGNGFIVVGYGKMGGIELGYSSDLDMVFLNNCSNTNAMTDGEKPTANETFFARMGRRMIHNYTTRTPAGILYETDMRLRPNGKSGMLVSTLDGFERYQKESAWTWEHQALIRARVVAGDATAAARFEAIRASQLCQPRNAQSLLQDVLEMRDKMRQSLMKQQAGQFDLKQGHGGIVDIEFMVQYLVLRWANEHPDIIEWTDNIRLLEKLSEHQLMSGVQAEDLTSAYRAFRAVYHRKALQEQESLVADDVLLAEQSRVKAIWQELMLVKA